MEVVEQKKTQRTLFPKDGTDEERRELKPKKTRQFED